MWSKQGLTFFHRKIGSRFNFDLALEADGWIVRSDVIWYKKNPVPESVWDRCTQAREHIFMLVKSPDYRSDFEAIKPESKSWGKDHRSGIGRQTYNGARVNYRNLPDSFTVVNETCNEHLVWSIARGGHKGKHPATFPEELARRCILGDARRAVSFSIPSREGLRQLW